MTTSLKTIIPLALVCTVLVGYNYVDAQWVGPNMAPTGGNVPAPVNVGTAPQVKSGPLGVAALDVTGDASVALDIAVTGTTTSNRVHAALYCDENGQNCVDADVSLIGGGGGGGGEVAKFHTYHVTDPSRTCTQIVADANALVGDLSGGETGLGASTFIQDDNGMWQAEFTRGDCSPMSNRPAARITVPVDSDGNPIFGFYQNMGFLPSI